MSTLVIAEIGSAWRFGKPARHMDNAVRAIAEAKAAGADCCKFQWVSNPSEMERRRTVPAGSYEILAWPVGWLQRLATECQTVGIEFMCTAFVPADVRVIAPFVKRLKIASLEACDPDLLNACAQTKKPLLMSTGAMNRLEVQELIRYADLILPAHGLTLLHCTAQYPAPLDQLNLLAIDDGLTGYSDHSGDTLTGALAVAVGALAVEVHFRLDGTPKDNPDFMHSLSPADLRTYVFNIRKAEKMLGSYSKMITKGEAAMRQHQVRP
jgi:N,N'-diacetyllegionaminate synthase